MQSYQYFISDLADREYFGQKLGLERIRSFLDEARDPHRSYPSIHIAGTNGKGSTAAMLASVLETAGYRVGLYTSPHLEDFRERIRVAGRMISPEELMALVERLRTLERRLGIQLTFFEFTTALAFQYFADQKIDVAVVEVGLGGRLDATNVVIPLVSVITSIGLDHQQFLGDTIEKIAFEKAGIIKEGVPVVIGDLPPSAESVIFEVARKRSSSVARSGEAARPPLPHVGLAGEHQKTNASIVMEVVRLLNRSGFHICFPDMEKGLASVLWPGRLETVCDQPWILLDGAHNVEAIEKTVAYLEKEKKGRKVLCLLGMMEDKKCKEILSRLSSVVDSFVFTQVDSRRAAPPRSLQNFLRCVAGFTIPSECFDDLEKALEFSLKDLKAEDIFLITGSFYIAGAARSLLQKTHFFKIP